ncbi:MAG TPA: hypothetical protein VGX70_19680 [Gemmataceae bacterium]|jgi:hypothetical protein|nr:hypothetical protein [Gemmataceae bacterium]
MPIAPCPPVQPDLQLAAQSLLRTGQNQHTKGCADFDNACAAPSTRIVHTGFMQEALVNALRARRPKIRAHWEALLRAEPIATPLGHPDALVHLLDWTLDEIFSVLSNPLAQYGANGAHFTPHDQSECPCGRNPLLAYFAAGEQAMREALILAQAASVSLDPIERDASFDVLNLVLQQISRREITAFCGVCQFRQSSPEAGQVIAPSKFTELQPRCAETSG